MPSLKSSTTPAQNDAKRPVAKFFQAAMLRFPVYVSYLEDMIWSSGQWFQLGACAIHSACEQTVVSQSLGLTDMR